MNKIFLTFLFYSQLSFFYCQSWTQLLDFPGTARDDGIAFTINNKAYCLSGLEVGWQCTGNGYSFDGFSEVWSPIAPLPNGKERQYATGFGYNGFGYLLGGVNCSGICLKDFWQYSVSTNSWTALNDFPGQGRQGMSNFMINNKLYVVGGRLTDNSAINEVWEYNFTLNNWTQKNNLPVLGMWRGAAFAIDTVGYICYGISNTTSNTFNHHIFKYNHTNDVWSILPNITLPARNYIGCAVANKKAYLYGGQDSLNLITNDIIQFNAEDTSLVTYQGIPTIGRKGTMTFSLNDVIYITTGLDETQNRIKETWKNTDFVGLQENSSPLDVTIFPNPANEKLFLKINATSNVTIQMHNQIGEMLYTIDGDHKNIEINTSLFADGIYFLTCKAKHGTSQKKLIINH
jgi:N-acetylneuraminic acid mutarotase